MLESTLVGNRYRVERPLGVGGMATVYLATDTAGGRPVALKVMAASWVGDREAQRRFRYEHQVMAGLEHAGVPWVGDLGLTDSGVPYFAMELVVGRSLDGVGSLSPVAVRHLLLALLPILGHLHGRGLVHGDIKAQNLMCVGEADFEAGPPVLKLMDFGLASGVGARSRGIEGTLTHLAPELVHGRRTDPRVDLYALGVMVYEWLTGQLPFLGSTPTETIQRHLRVTPPMPSACRADIGTDLDALTMRLLAKHPEDRVQSVGEALSALGVSIGGDEPPALILNGHFVAREVETRQFLDVLAGLQPGTPTTPLYVHGASGVGKSHCLDEWAIQAGLMGFGVLTGRCPASSQPLGLWLDLAADALALGRSLAPEAAEAFGESWRAIQVSIGLDEVSLEAFGSALRVLLSACAAKERLVVMVDDWDRADGLSKALWSRLVQSLSGAGIQWVLSLTAVPPTGSRTLVLEPFDEACSGLFVQKCLGTEAVPVAIAQALHEASQGEVRALEDLLQHLVKTRQLVRGLDGWRLVKGSKEALPVTLAQRYELLLASLTPPALEVGELLAVSSVLLGVEHLASLAGQSLVDCERSLGELQAARVAVHEHAGWTLRDLALRDWWQTRLGEAGRLGWHEKLTDLLLDWASTNPSQQILNALAEHGVVVLAPERLLPWMIKAAEQNLVIKAFADAKRFAQQALSMAGMCADDVRLELLEVLVSAHRGLGEGNEALEMAREALAIARALGRPAAIARSLNGLGKVHQLAGRYDLARQMFEEVAAFSEELVPTELCRAHRALGRLSYFAGDPEGAYRHGRCAIQLARRHLSRMELAQVLAETGETFQGNEDRLQEGLHCLEEADGIAQELNNNNLQSVSKQGLGNLQLGLGRLAEARESFRQAAELFETVGNQGEALFARLNVSLVCEEQGYFVQSERLAKAVAAEASRLGRKFPLAAALAVDGSAMVYQGRSREGLKALEEALGLAKAIGHRHLEALIVQILGPIRLLLGQFEALVPIIEELLAFGAASKADEHYLRGVLLKIELAQCQGRVADLNDLDDVFNGPNAHLRAQAHLLRARAARLGGDRSEAISELLVVRTLIEELDVPRLSAALWLEMSLVAESHEESESAIKKAVAVVEDTSQRHVLVAVLVQQAALTSGKQGEALRARARELVTQLAADCGDEADCYWQVGERARLRVSHAPPSEPVVAGSLQELRDLARRLEMGLAQFEAEQLGSGRAERNTERLRQIVEFANSVNSIYRIEALMKRALTLVIAISAAERGMVVLKDEDAMTTQYYQTAPGYTDDSAGSEQYSRSVARTVLESGETVCVLNAGADERFAQQASVMGLNLQTIICVPLKHQGDILGAIYVDRQGFNEQFSNDDLDTINALASLTCQALVNARLIQAQEERQLHLEMLNRLSQELSRTLEVTTVFRLIAEMVGDLTQAERVLVLKVENEQMVYAAGRDVRQNRFIEEVPEYSESICQRVLQTQRGQTAYNVDGADAADTSVSQSMASLRLHSVVAVPILGQTGVSGVLYVDSQTRLAQKLEREMLLLASLASTASLAIDNARLYHQATIDGLTGLYVRSYLMMRIEEEIRRTRRFGGRFSILVCDIDYFKSFNDTYGHVTGDAVLKHVSQVIKSTVRTSLDIVARYGGEELILLLPETDAASAVITAERVRRNVESNAYQHPEMGPLRVTVSLGVASYPAAINTAIELFELADHALYESKRNGRNRTTLSDESKRATTEGNLT